MKNLKKAYKKRKKEIKQKLEEFRTLKKDLFVELCFCLCTPLSKAERVIQIINDENKELLLKGSKERIAKALKGYARFHNNKAKYIVEARKNMRLLKKLPKDNIKARDFLLKNFKGLGLKEANHFLRNVGYKEVAILDGHIINCMYEFGAIKSNTRPASKKQYEELTKKFKMFSKKVKIPLDELDLLFWSSKTGCILK